MLILPEIKSRHTSVDKKGSILLNDKDTVNNTKDRSFDNRAQHLKFKIATPIINTNSKVRIREGVKTQETMDSRSISQDDLKH